MYHWFFPDACEELMHLLAINQTIITCPSGELARRANLGVFRPHTSPSTTHCHRDHPNNSAYHIYTRQVTLLTLIPYIRASLSDGLFKTRNYRAFAHPLELIPGSLPIFFPKAAVYVFSVSFRRGAETNQLNVSYRQRSEGINIRELNLKGVENVALPASTSAQAPLVTRGTIWYWKYVIGERCEPRTHCEHLWAVASHSPILRHGLQGISLG